MLLYVNLINVIVKINIRTAYLLKIKQSLPIFHLNLFHLNLFKTL